MKKRIAAALCVILVLITVFLIGTGFQKSSFVAMVDYSLSDDGKALTFTTMVGTSMGYTRGYRDDPGENSHFLTFYATFGGLNSRLGAQHEFVLELDENDTEIYFNRVSNYQLVLQKNPLTGQWERPQ